MTTLTLRKPLYVHPISTPIKSQRVDSIDLLRGIVMIIMALDHVRDYFHASAFHFDPTDLTQTSVVLFFTRWITHYCAPIFVFLAGVSAHLYGARRTKKELSLFLLTRGLWLVFAELFIVTLGWTFNPAYPIFNLQVIWAIGISMIALSALVYLPLRIILLAGIVLIAGHNLLDTVHLKNNGSPSIGWAFLHEPGDFVIGRFTFMIHYPVIPWIGIMAIGYYFGRFYRPDYDPDNRRTVLLSIGISAIALFIILRSDNFYGDAAHWSSQKTTVFSVMSFINVTKYPPSLLYTLMTLGPAMLFLGLAERPLNWLGSKITVLGRVPFFYYILHIFLIHLLAIAGAAVAGYHWWDMILSNRVNRTPGLKEYGFNLQTVYIVWIAVVLFLYPLCKRFDRYKKSQLAKHWWLSYL